MLSLEGKQLGNYDVIRRIRVGGMGAVYEGRQRTAFDRRVAIKVILGNYANDRDMRRRFAREARTVARLHHPHILPLIEFGDAQGILYLVMPFIDGGTLTSYLRRSLPDLAEVAAIYQQLLDAVEYAHDEGLVHRDIKSSNVLLEMRRNASPYVYLADFGLVRTSRMTEAEQSGKPIPLDQVPGTPHYMAPEQTRGIVTPLTDIYALGVLLYQMLTGELPFNDPDDVRVIQMHLQSPIPSPCDHDASIPEELAEVVRMAMAKRPEARYPNVAALRKAFLAAMQGPVSAALEETPPEQERVSPRQSVPLVPQAPQPIVMSRRMRNEAAVAAPQPVRVTESIKQRPRITEEPVQLPHKRLTFPMLISMLVPVVLLILLLMPRLLGVSLFPSGFPLFGTPPVATIFVTAQSKELQDKFLLTASPQVKAPNLATHTIPSRLVQSSLSSSRSVATTGTKGQGGAYARGFIEFINTSNTPFTISSQMSFTSTTGVQFQIIQSVQVPARDNGRNGRVTIMAVATSAGAQGNIPAHSLDGACCSRGITLRNTSPFQGGTDGQMIQVVAQSDLDAVQRALVPQLQQSLTQQLQKQVAATEAIAGQPIFTVSTSSNPHVNDQGNQVQVTVTVQGMVPVYNRDVVNDTAIQLLNKQATQTLNGPYQVKGKPVIAAPSVVESGKNGVVYLSVSVRGLWVYNLTASQMNSWPQSVKGATTAAAIAYLNAQPGVAGVEIRLPFGADHLPNDVNEIRIALIEPVSKQP